MIKGKETNYAPSPIGPYSQSMIHKGSLYISGQAGIDPITAELVSGGIEKETVQTCKNIEAILKANDISFAEVVKTTCFLKDMADYAKFNKIYAEYFVSKPARSTVAVKELPLGAACEIEVIATI